MRVRSAGAGHKNAEPRCAGSWGAAGAGTGMRIVLAAGAATEIRVAERRVGASCGAEPFGGGKPRVAWDLVPTTVPVALARVQRLASRVRECGSRLRVEMRVAVAAYREMRVVALARVQGLDRVARVKSWGSRWRGWRGAGRRAGAGSGARVTR
jgi:hypothetical protein